MDYKINEDNGFRYIETNPNSDKEVLLLLHGLFGALSNFKGIIEHFKDKYNVVVPMLPIFELPIREVSVTGFVEHVKEFVEYKKYPAANVLGNSLGGHITLLFTLAYPKKVKSVTLTGSSGLFENSLGNTFPRRGDKTFIENKTKEIFYNQDVASDELVDEVYDIVNDRNKAIRIIATAKSAVRHNLADKLHQINVPTLLLWGKQDVVTPAFVGEKFNELITDSELHIIDKCGHAPMMELPDDFNALLETFLTKVN